MGGAGLQPPDTATTVKLREGERHVQDGPYAVTKEQLGGFFIITMPDLSQLMCEVFYPKIGIDGTEASLR